MCENTAQMKDPVVKKVNKISVAHFYEVYRSQLELELLNSPIGMGRSIIRPALNRPGLALSGFFGYYAQERIQIFGSGEMAYLAELKDPERSERMRLICGESVPCLIFSRGADVSGDIISIADECSVPVFRSTLPTMSLVNRATIILENEFADSVTLHGCMVDVRGIGVLITGPSGIGKSEISLGLVERGASLVADDMVFIRNVSGDLIASSPKLSSGYIEIRGIGITNVTDLYGLRAYRQQKKIHLIIDLIGGEMSETERLGLERKVSTILGVEVERITLPVAPGRDMTRLVEVAALGQYLRQNGYDMALEFSRRLHEEISTRNIHIHGNDE